MRRAAREDLHQALVRMVRVTHLFVKSVDVVSACLSTSHVARRPASFFNVARRTSHVARLLFSTSHVARRTSHVSFKVNRAALAPK